MGMRDKQEEKKIIGSGQKTGLAGFQCGTGARSFVRTMQDRKKLNDFGLLGEIRALLSFQQRKKDFFLNAFQPFCQALVYCNQQNKIDKLSIDIDLLVQ